MDIDEVHLLKLSDAEIERIKRFASKRPNTRIVIVPGRGSGKSLMQFAFMKKLAEELKKEDENGRLV